MLENDVGTTGSGSIEERVRVIELVVESVEVVVAVAVGDLEGNRKGGIRDGQVLLLCAQGFSAGIDKEF